MGLHIFFGFPLRDWRGGFSEDGSEQESRGEILATVVALSVWVRTVARIGQMVFCHNKTRSSTPYTLV